MMIFMQNTPNGYKNEFKLWADILFEICPW